MVGHVGDDLAAHVVERGGEDGEEGNEGVFVDVSVESHQDDDENHEDASAQHHVAHIEGDGEEREEQGYDGGAIADSGQNVHGEQVMAIYPHHADGESHGEQQHRELSYRHGHVGDEVVLEFEPHHKIDHASKACEEQGACHSFAVEHEKKGKIDKGRTRFLLCHDEQHGKEDEGDGDADVFVFFDVEAVAVHPFAQSQRNGKLGELGWLYLDRFGDGQPGARTFRFGRDDDGHQQE